MHSKTRKVDFTMIRSCGAQDALRSCQERTTLLAYGCPGLPVQGLQLLSAKKVVLTRKVSCLQQRKLAAKNGSNKSFLHLPRKFCMICHVRVLFSGARVRIIPSSDVNARFLTNKKLGTLHTPTKILSNISLAVPSSSPFHPSFLFYFC